MPNEPGVVLVKPWGKDQGNYVRLNESDFDPAVHVKVGEDGNPIEPAAEDGDGPDALRAAKGPGGRWFVKRGKETVAGPFATEDEARAAADKEIGG